MALLFFRLPAVEALQGLPWPAGPEFQSDAASHYWSASTFGPWPPLVWGVNALDGAVGTYGKQDTRFARAVRSGS